MAQPLRSPLRYRPILYSLGGVSTIFGVPSCDVAGCTSGSDVMQYSGDEDAWVVVGAMKEARSLPIVVEVLRVCCFYSYNCSYSYRSRAIMCLSLLQSNFNLNLKNY